MTESLKLIGFLARAIMAGLAIAFVVIYLWPSLANRLDQPVAPATIPAAPFSYAEAVNRAAPAVVSIYTKSLQPQSMDPDPAARTGYQHKPLGWTLRASKDRRFRPGD